MNKRLLHTPEGVRDIYGLEYQRKLELQRSMRECIASYGYDAIQTPTFEFFDVFEKEVGTTLSKDLYKLVDKEGDTLVLRPDFTPSVARCAAKYFMDKEEPIRFTYEGNVYANVSNLQGKLKEYTQMGAELICDDSVEADGEMLAMVVDTLLATGLTQFQVTVGNDAYFKGLCEEAGLDSDSEQALRELLSEKQYFAARTYLDNFTIQADAKAALLLLADFFGGLTDLQALKTNTKNVRALEAIDRLLALEEILKAYGINEYVSFDLAMLSKYHYYTGIIFKAYTYGLGDAIAKGGRYDKLLSYFGKDASAVGFMVVVDEMMEALSYQKIAVKTPEAKQTIFYTKETYMQALAKAKQLRSKGCKVVLLAQK
ncbi:MAG: ATP phosphoribosyltransferase regulatory subunit [Lachnospiraceae bacterium]